MSGISAFDLLVVLEDRIRKVEISIAKVCTKLDSIKERLDRTITIKDCAMIAAIIVGAIMGAIV